MAFNYYFGPMHLCMISAFKISELDLVLVDQLLEKSKGQLKHRDERRRAQAEMACEYLEPLKETLEAADFGV